ncbi:MAG: DEAD/DEAH box helicase [Pyrobaculum sp.]
MCRSSDIFKKLGISYWVEVLGGQVVEKTGLYFRDVLTNLCRREVSLCNFELYKHQYEALTKLFEGRSVVLRASTGSGKTEVWIGYLLERKARGEPIKALAIYPTKALAGEQLARISKYFKEAGLYIEERPGRFLIGDVVRYDGDVSVRVSRQDVLRATLILTNPEVLLLAMEDRNHKLSPYLDRVNLIIVDELDFYKSFRSALLLHLLSLISKNRQVQYVLLSATITSVEDMKKFIGDVVEIKGEAPRPPKHVYIALGKEGSIVYPIKVLRLKNLHRQILDNNRQLLVDLLEAYKDCEESTLVFAPSIDWANRLGGGASAPVHHSQIDRYRRREIEEKLRNGEYKLVVTVKTLLQGIDIGGIQRVIHVGLPHTVREFIQREGRMGRRAVEFTESVIVPIREEDLVILEEGVEGLKRWEQLGPETLILDPENEALKLYDHCLGAATLTESELKKYGVDKIRCPGFYEMVRHKPHIQYYIDEKGYERLDDSVSRKYYVEYYQPGAVEADPPSVVITTRRNVIVKAAAHYLSQLQNGARCANEVYSPVRAIYDALLWYYSTCRDWWQEPQFAEDIKRGKLWSKVYVTVLFEGAGGFKKVREIPCKVAWYLESRRKFRMYKPDGTEVETYDVRKLILNYTPRPWYPYVFFTYVYVVEVDPRHRDPAAIDRGISFIKAILRRKYGIDLHLLKSYLEPTGLLKVWEEEPVGLLPKLRKDENIKMGDKVINCDTLLKEVKTVEIDDQLRLLLEYIDPYEFAPHRLDIPRLRQEAEVALYYICNAVPIKFREEVVLVPKTPKHTILVVDKFTTAETEWIGYTVVDEEAHVIAISNSINDLPQILAQRPDVEEVVLYGVTKKEVPIKFIKPLDITEFVTKRYGDPLPLARAREEIFGKQDLLELLNTITNKIIEAKVETNEQAFQKELQTYLTHLFKLRAETIAVLYNLYKVVNTT